MSFRPVSHRTDSRSDFNRILEIGINRAMADASIGTPLAVDGLNMTAHVLNLQHPLDKDSINLDTLSYADRTRSGIGVHFDGNMDTCRAKALDYHVLDEEGFEQWKREIKNHQKDPDVMYYLRRQSIPVRVHDDFFIGIAPCSGYGLASRRYLGTDVKEDIEEAAKESTENANLLACISDELDPTVAFFRMLMRGELCDGVKIEEGVLTRRKVLPSYFFLDFPREDPTAVKGGDSYKMAFQMITSAAPGRRDRLHLSGAHSAPLQRVTINVAAERWLSERDTPLRGTTHLDLLRAAAIVFRLCPAHILKDASSYPSKLENDHFILTESFAGFEASLYEGDEKSTSLRLGYHTTNGYGFLDGGFFYLHPSLFRPATDGGPLFKLLVDHHLILAYGLAEDDILNLKEDTYTCGPGGDDYVRAAVEWTTKPPKRKLEVLSGGEHRPKLVDNSFTV